MIKKILVANRGEIAMRIFRTFRVMNMATVAIYTRVDRGALHVRYAEEAYCISDSPEDTSYLKPEKILEIAKKTGAAIHPGYGFLSENADSVSYTHLIWMRLSKDMFLRICNLFIQIVYICIIKVL